MTVNGWLQIAIYAAIIIAITAPLGGYMMRVFNGERTFLSPILRPIERLVYRLCLVDENEDQHWTVYAVGMLLFSFAGFVILYAVQRLQNLLPFSQEISAKHDHLPAVGEHLAFNTSISFVTNTNWQSYTPEATMTYLTQMAGLTVHNFVSAATGIVLAVALVRGFARRSAKGVGNFWVDLTRCVLYILLPLAIVVGLFFV
ncbi:MAG TPA: potassium-transporting ATPase subunit KdpA, partial [Rhizomicrobium sp.]|nr:potassium-transporting ATPase subunit KdpA [Rhizomicrobium sp.]